MLSGCYTALMTPFTDAFEIDYGSLERLVEFQIAGGVSGILVASVWSWDEMRPPLSQHSPAGVVRLLARSVFGHQ